MARPKVPFTPPEARDADADADDRSLALARTLEAELTRQATRAQPAARPAPAVWGAPKASLDLSSSFAPADVVTEEVAPNPSGALPWLGNAGLPLPVDIYALGRWMLLLGLANIVLSGFILMYWGIPQWEMRSMRALAGFAAGATDSSASDAASTGGSNRRRGNATDRRYRIDPNATVTGASPVLRSSARGGAAGGSGTGGEGTAGANINSNGGVSGSVARNGAAVPAVPEPVLIATTPDVDPPASSSSGPAAATVPAPAATAAPGAPGAGAAGLDLSRASTENALSMVQTASRADTRNPGVAVAGEAGVSMPERLPESYVRPSIATLPGAEPITGEVKLAAVVRANGSVQDLAVLSTSRQGAGLEQAALAAVRQWRYKPAMRDGAPVDARLTITVSFR